MKEVRKEICKVNTHAVGSYLLLVVDIKKILGVPKKSMQICLESSDVNLA